MNLTLSEDALAVQQQARDFATQRLRPHAIARDLSHALPLEQLNALAKKGMMGINCDPKYGGLGAGVVPYALTIMELGKEDASVGVVTSVNNMVAEVLQTFATEEQKQQYLVPLLKGDSSAGSFCLSEPGSGSDAAGMLTRATKVEGGWVIDGTKSWITSGQHAGVFIVWAQARDGDEELGISVFLVDPASEGVGVGVPERKMGQKGSDTVTLTFDQVRVADDAVFGQLGRGFKIAMMALDGGRIGVSALAWGIAFKALEEARVLFDKTGAPSHDVQAQLDALDADLEAARLMILHAAWLKNRGERAFTQEASMAKVFTTELASRAAEQALAWFGPQVHVRGTHTLERLVRDARVTRIYEGTSEIQRIVIARHIIKNAN